MSKRLKNIHYCWALLVFLIFTVPAGTAGTDNKSLEPKLDGTNRNKRLDVLIDLMEGTKVDAPKKAQEYGNEALKLLQDSPGDDHKITVLNLLSTAYANLGDYRAALDYASQARDLAETNGNRPGLADALDAIGWAYRYVGAFNPALENFSRAQTIYHELGRQQKVANSLTGMGLIYWKTSEYSRAVDYFLKQIMHLWPEIHYLTVFLSTPAISWVCLNFC